MTRPGHFTRVWGRGVHSLERQWGKREEIGLDRLRFADGGLTARPIDDFESLGPAPDGVHPLDLLHESSERRPASRARGLSVGKYHQVVVSRQGAVFDPITDS